MPVASVLTSGPLDDGSRTDHPVRAGAGAARAGNVLWVDPHDAEPGEDYDWDPSYDSPRWVQVGKVMLAMTPIMMLVILIGVGLIAAVLAVLAYLFLDLAASGFGP